MLAASPESLELQATLDRVRAMLEAIVVRGIRACGGDELAQLKSFATDLERCGAGHVAGLLAELHGQMERDDRRAARTLLSAQTAVRLLERLLTLRVVRLNYDAAIAIAAQASDGGPAESEDGQEGS